MFTKVTVAVAIVLIVTSGASATSLLAGSIWQQQQFSVGNALNPGISSLLNLVHNDSTGSMMQNVDIINMQAAPVNSGFGLIGGMNPLSSLLCFGSSCATEAYQGQVGDLTQSVMAGGQCGVISVNAFLDAAGGQEQTIGASTSPKLQLQTLGVAADQVLMRQDGAGGGTAVNSAALSQGQSGSNAAGTVFEASTINATQVGTVGGGANSTVSLVGGMNATTGQSQMVY
jgi:hypothetical protein